MADEPTNDHDAALQFSARGNTRWIIVRGKTGQRFDRWLVRRIGISIITWQYAKAGGNRYQPTLLLTTIGKRSGKLRPRALPFTVDGDRWIVVGSNGGGPKDPDWVWNIRANDAAWIVLNRHEIAVRAHVAHGEERARIFALLSSTRDSIARYQERAATFGREVPLVVLERRAVS